MWSQAAQLPASHPYPFMIILGNPLPGSSLAGLNWVELSLERGEKVRAYLQEAQICCQFRGAKKQEAKQQGLNKGKHSK